jgi:hypothetical protein
MRWKYTRWISINHHKQYKMKVFQSHIQIGFHKNEQFLNFSRKMKIIPQYAKLAVQCHSQSPAPHISEKIWWKQKWNKCSKTFQKQRKKKFQTLSHFFETSSNQILHRKHLLSKIRMTTERKPESSFHHYCDGSHDHNPNNSFLLFVSSIWKLSEWSTTIEEINWFLFFSSPAEMPKNKDIEFAINQIN